ncbi:MAG: MarC family protein, partial [Candidatus Omnitrophica bacterium]|nr:MarC family protein [Candidatus Omnitrophota bacterium]
PLIADRISATGINIFTRIMGLVLAAIAVEFI